MILLVLATAMAQDCPAPVSPDSLLATIEQADAAFAALDLDAFETAADRAETELVCVDAPLTPNQAASYHRLQALVAFAAQDDADVRAAYGIAKQLDPAWSLPLSIAPDGHPLRPLFDGASPPTTDTFAVADPVYVDGSESTALPESRPAVVQLVDRRGTTQHSIWLEAPSPTDLPAWIELPPPPRPKKVHKLGKPFAIAAGASAVAASSLYAASWATRAKYLDADTDLDKLGGLEKANHATLVGAGITGGLALGFGGAALVFPW